MKKIYSELSRIQRDLKAPKNLYNSFGKYSYRNAEGILEAVKPLLNGLALVINDEPVLIGNRFYIKATVTLTDGEDQVSAVAYAREDEIKKGMDGCQITGACSSYARKYALNALLMIDDAKDSDDDSLSPKNPKNSGEKLDLKPAGESFTPPSGGKAEVGTAGKIPVDSVANFIRNEITDIQGIAKIRTYEEAKRQVMEMAAELVRGGSIPDFDWRKLTMDEARNIFKAIRELLPVGAA